MFFLHYSKNYMFKLQHNSLTCLNNGSNQAQMHHTTKTDQSCRLTSQSVKCLEMEAVSKVTFISIDEPIKILRTHF